MSTDELDEAPQIDCTIADVSTRKVLCRLRVPRGVLHLAEEGKVLVVITPTMIHTWDSHTGKRLGEIRWGSGQIGQGWDLEAWCKWVQKASSPDGGFLVVGDRAYSAQVELWDVFKGRVAVAPSPNHWPIGFTADGTRVYFSGRGFSYWDLRSNVVHSWKSDESDRWAEFSFTPDGRYATLGSNCHWEFPPPAGRSWRR
jgi:hypothetical protein